MKLLRLFSYLLLALSLVYFGHAIWLHAAQIPAIAWDAAAISAGIVALALYLIQFATSGLAWHLWLRAIGEPTRPGLAIALTSLAQFAKYVPGSIAQHIARVALAARYGMSAAGVVISIGLETGWSLAAGAGIAVMAAVILGLPLFQGVADTTMITVLALVGVTLMVPSLGIWLLERRRPAWLARWLGPAPLRHPTLPTILGCCLLYALNHVICGVILTLLGARLFGAPEAPLLFTIGVFALSWMAGLVVLVAPGGIGVREAVLMAGLAPVYGPATALAMAIAYRVISSLGDGLGFLFGLLAERRLGKSDAA
jgi:uncharacterized membrane protein YbhN (UPF0104 family)